MAKSDGTVYVDTKIDTSGIGKGIETVKNKIGSVTNSVKKFGDYFKKSFTEAPTGNAGRAYEEVAQDIKKAEAQLDKLIEKQIRFVEIGGNKESKAFLGMEYDIEFLRNKLEELRLEASKSLDTLPVSNLERLEKAFVNLGEKINSSGKKLLKFVGKSILNGLEKLGGKIKKLISTMFNLDKSTKKANFSMLKMLGTSIAFSSVFRAISMVVNGFKEGMNNLVQYSDEVNTSMSALKSSLTQLKNSFATAFSPILSTVTPILVSFINLISKAATAVAAFFSALNGKSTYTKAVAVQEDYAASLKDTSKNANDAKKSLSKYLSGLDEIRTFTSKEKESDVENVGISPEMMFTEEEIPVPISAFAEKVKEIYENIKKMFQNQDWKGLGLYTAGLLNQGLQYLYDVLSWDNVKDKIVPFIKGFTEFFNYFVSGFDWNMLGRTIGTGINTIVNSLNLLIEGIDWVNLGTSFAKGVNGLFSEVDWKNLGNLIGNKFMIAWDIFRGFVTNLDYAEIGLSIAQGINGVLEKIDLGEIGSSLSMFVIGFLEMLTIAIQETNWEEVGRQIAEMLKNIDWIGIAKGLWDAGVALIGGLLEAFNELPGPVKLVIALFAGFLAASNLSGIIMTIMQLISVLAGSGGLMGVLGAIASALGPGGLIALAIGAAVAAIALLILNWDEVKEIMGNVIEYIKNVFATDWTEVFGPVLGGILNDFFQKIEDIFNGIKKIFEGIIDFVAGVFTGDWEKAWNGVKNIFAGIWDSLLAIIKKPINGIIGIINGLVRGVVEGINFIIRALNNLNFDIPDWVPFVGGESIGFSINELTAPQIPYLATGAVIPPNAPFMAVLGDQRHGTNIEAPLDTIKQAVREVVGNGNGGGQYQFTAQINRRTLFEEMIDEAKLRQSTSGRNPFDLA